MDALAEHISTYAARLTFDDLTAEAVDGMKRRLVDSIGCGLGGFPGEPVGMARELAREVVGDPPAHVWFTGETTTPEMATFVNGMMLRYLDFNDTYMAREGGHPSDIVAPVLAIADAWCLSGRDALLAMVVAYEVVCGLAEVERLSVKTVDHSLHVAAGSAVGVGKAMGLDAKQIANALSIAIVSNLSLRVVREGHLSMWKAGSAAHAARNGLFAAQLARRGMTGPDLPFAAEGGLSGMLGEMPGLPAFGGDGRPFHSELSSIKPFPAQYNAQASITAALELRERTGGELPTKLTVRTYGHAVRSCAGGPEKWHVTTRETADHSIPYVVALSLLDGELTPAQFAPERIVDTTVHELMSRITVEEDAEMTPRFPGAPSARIEAVLASGHSEVVEVLHAKGHPANPLSVDEIEAKFRSMADGLMPTAVCEALLSRLWAFDAETDVSSLVRATVVT